MAGDTGFVEATSAGSEEPACTGTLNRDEHMNNCLDNIEQACVMSLCNICSRQHKQKGPLRACAALLSGTREGGVRSGKPVQVSVRTVGEFI